MDEAAQRLEELIGILSCPNDDPQVHNAALEELILCTQARGWQFAYSILQNREQVEDVLQDCYFTVYRNLGQLKDRRAFWGWFKRIVVNRCLRVKEQANLELSEIDQPAQAPDLDSKVDVRRAFGQLSTSDRTVLGLREILDLSYDEISALLDVPLTTVKTRIFNARTRLQNIFLGRNKGGRS